ncbi:DotH/IcmK family type IV secretion protein [Paraburkholderia sp. BR10872]|uniref:DotH/IcmK family type IV secretion protein n=1 Tax=Paraburkholderia sp. BR10872 TaxID=3236989 RepID=UPI0034D22089
MRSPRCLLVGSLLIAFGAADIADAQTANPANAGAAQVFTPGAAGSAQAPGSAGAANPGSSATAGATAQRGGQGVAYSNLATPQPLPPLEAPNQSIANYDAAVNAVSPLTADQIRALRKRIDDSRRAANASPTRPPKPVYSTQTVDLSPGAPPPIVRVSDLGSAVTFIDAGGNPWDIVEVNNLAKGRFDVLHPVPNVPTITITAQGGYVEGDVAVFLKGLSFPVVLKMVAGQRETDYRMDVRIPRRGPNAIAPARSTPEIGLPSDVMQAILDGTQTTRDATPVKMENAPQGMTAFAEGDHIMLRTNLFLSNPAFFGSIAGADGTHVYDIPRTPVVTVTENGVERNVILDLE